MIRIVDKRNMHVVQKVIRPNGGLVTYQAGIPGDYGLLQQFKTLREARAYIGIETGKENQS